MISQVLLFRKIMHHKLLFSFSFRFSRALVNFGLLKE